MAALKADVIVLTWNHKTVIKNFVESFFANTTVPCRLIIIDNGSSDGTGEYLAGLKETDLIKLRITLNSDNKGFVGGMNQGIEISDAPYVCLANDDLIFTKGWLEEILFIFEKNKNIGLLNPNSNNLGAHPNTNEGIDSFASGLREKFKGLFVEMPFCVGFCLFIRREVIEKAGVLSTEFAPFFFEDSDYSLKVLQAGYAIGVAKGSYVWHKEHASINKLGKKKEEYFSRSREAFCKKWGKILRVLIIVRDEQEIDEYLEGAISLTRQGNYVWIALKDLKKSRSEIFQQRGMAEHSGINFINYSSIIGIIWKIMVKKKKYDIIITGNKAIKTIFSALRFNILPGFDFAAINKIKYSLNIKV